MSESMGIAWMHVSALSNDPDLPSEDCAMEWLASLTHEEVGHPGLRSLHHVAPQGCFASLAHHNRAILAPLALQDLDMPRIQIYAIDSQGT